MLPSTRQGQWAYSHSECPSGALQAVMFPGELSGPLPPQVGQEMFLRKDKDGDSARRKEKEQVLMLACGQLRAGVWLCLVPTFRLTLPGGLGTCRLRPTDWLSPGLWPLQENLVSSASGAPCRGTSVVLSSRFCALAPRCPDGCPLGLPCLRQSIPMWALEATQDACAGVAVLT